MGELDPLARELIEVARRQFDPPPGFEERVWRRVLAIIKAERVESERLRALGANDEK